MISSVLPKLAKATLALLLLNGAALAQADLAAQLEPIRVQHNLPALAAAVSLGGTVVAAGAVGTRVTGKDLPVTIDDRFHIGSDTKAMTATLAGTLVDAGLMSWNSRVGDVLGAAVPGMSAGLQAVTLVQLLSHSSGIPSDDEIITGLYFDPAAAELTPEAARLWVIDAWKQHAPAIPPGDSAFQYANLGYLIAGAMIEQAAGEPWEALIHQRIFTPLGLSTAGLGAQATLGLYDAPVGHLLADDGSPLPMAWGPAADVPALLGPAGNAHMSVLDFVRWGAWNASLGQGGPALVTPATLAEIHRPHLDTPRLDNPPPGTPQSGGYALGWGLVTPAWAAEPLLMHNGSNGMNLAKILVDPARDLSIAVVTNMPGPQASLAVEAVMDALFTAFAADPS